MDYRITIDKFEGPLDLLLHLIKQADVNIFDISIDTITKQYLDFINRMEELNLDIASEYLVMAAELLEMKSSILLPKHTIEDSDEYEEDPREQLINKLLEYQHYKEVTGTFKELEFERQKSYTKEPYDLSEYNNTHIETDVDLEKLMEAFDNLIQRKIMDRPLNTKITNKEYSITKRSKEIVDIITKKKKVNFIELFDIMTKDYIVITFLSILSLAKKQEINIKQDDNFKEIILEAKGK